MKLFIFLLVISMNFVIHASEKVVFAGGCFWCMEPSFDKLAGVLKTTSGYAGGTAADATYEKVSSGSTAHLESVQVEFDPAKISYDKLLETYWKNIDPLNDRGQFCDEGSQYKSAIFVGNQLQEKAAQKSLEEIAKRLKRPVVTKILPFTTFYPAEEYHQDYYSKNPIRYKYYRGRCGRDKRLDEVWGH